MKKLFILLLLSSITSPCLADPSKKGSTDISNGASYIVMSPILSLEGRPIQTSVAFSIGTMLTVVGISTLANETVKVIVENAKDGSQFAVHISARVAKESSLTVGTSVRAIAESTGYILVASGKLIAYIPNQLGQELLHQSKMD